MMASASLRALLAQTNGSEIGGDNEAVFSLHRFWETVKEQCFPFPVRHSQGVVAVLLLELQLGLAFF